MKKSEIYYMLQELVLGDEDYFDYLEKLQALRELFVQEDLAKITETQAAKENETAEARL